MATARIKEVVVLELSQEEASLLFAGVDFLTDFDGIEPSIYGPLESIFFALQDLGVDHGVDFSAFGKRPGENDG